jgi:hypothetical protein
MGGRGLGPEERVEQGLHVFEHAVHARLQALRGRCVQHGADALERITTLATSANDVGSDGEGDGKSLLVDGGERVERVLDASAFTLAVILPAHHYE